jgi:hypothetical protein
MDSVQEQESKKQKLEQEPCEEQEPQQEEQEEAQYTEEDLKLGHALLEAVIANDLVKL